MGFRHNGHRGRTSQKGEDYVKLYCLEKWINQCSRCQRRGRKPEMPDQISRDAINGNHHAANVVKKHFDILALNNGLCEECHGNTDR